MVTKKRMGMATAAVCAIGAGTLAFSAPSGAGGVVAMAALHDASGERVGQVQFRVRHHRVVGTIEVELPSDSSRFHGFHIHANSDPANGTDCVGPTFASADGHWNPAGAGHGNHSGDLPPLLLGPDGRSRAEFDVGHFTPGELSGLAVIIHAGPDNLANIPTRYTAAGVPGPDAATLGTGDAGGRFACGVIKPRAH